MNDWVRRCAWVLACALLAGCSGDASTSTGQSAPVGTPEPAGSVQQRQSAQPTAAEQAAATATSTAVEGVPGTAEPVMVVEPVVVVELVPELAITVDDLGQFDWNDRVDLRLEWEGDVAVIRRATACGDECIGIQTLRLKHHPDNLPSFESYVRQDLDFGYNEETTVEDGRLELSAWEPGRELAGRFTSTDGDKLVFWFGAFASTADGADIALGDLRDALRSDDPVARVDALGAIADHPVGRLELLEDLLDLLDDPAPVPPVYVREQWSFWGSSDGHAQVIGEHASFALNEVVNGRNAPSVNFMQPHELWVAIERVEGVPNPSVSRRDAVRDNWLTAADANAVVGEGSALAGLYYRLADEPCAFERVEQPCIDMVHLLCNGAAVWNVEGRVVAGEWSGGSGTIVLTSADGNTRVLPFGSENEWPPTSLLSRHEFNGRQCQ